MAVQESNELNQSIDIGANKMILDEGQLDVLVLFLAKEIKLSEQSRIVNAFISIENFLDQTSISQ